MKSKFPIDCYCRALSLAPKNAPLAGSSFVMSQQNKEQNKELNKEQIAFNPNDDYSTTLQMMSLEFDERWDNPTVSPQSNLHSYVQRAVLGHGSFGTVLLVREKHGKNYFAAKMMSKELLVRQKQVQHVHNEKHVLSAIRFPFLIYLIDSSKDFDHLYLILPVVNGGELFTYHRRMRKFNERHARFYAAQVVLALEYMHQMNLMYRDLKPENILLDDRGYIKLTDFGFAKRVESRTLTLCGTPEYLAPEIVQLRPYTKSVDWWAFGILIYEFVAGQSPFAAFNKDVILMYNRICNCDYKKPIFFTGTLTELVDSLLQVDTSRRLGNSNEGAVEIKNHPWFQSVDWYSMLNKEIPAPYVPTVAGSEDLSNFQNFQFEEPLKSKVNRHVELFAKF